MTQGMHREKCGMGRRYGISFAQTTLSNRRFNVRIVMTWKRGMIEVIHVSHTSLKQGYILNFEPLLLHTTIGH
jgi:hypothetical protein